MVGKAGTAVLFPSCNMTLVDLLLGRMPLCIGLFPATAADASSR